MMRHTLSLGVSFLVGFVGCGPDKPPQQPEPQPLAAPEPPPEPEVEPLEEGEGGAGGGAAAAEPEPPKPSGRPMILMGPQEAIESTFGATPGAVLKLTSSAKAPITLKIPEFALPGGFNIEFATVKKDPPKHSGLVGEVARLQIVRAEKVRPLAVTTKSSNYEVRWPLYDRNTINLAIGTASGDDKGNVTGDVSWRVVAPTSVDETFGYGYFYVDTIGPITYLHGTSSEVEPAPEG